MDDIKVGVKSTALRFGENTPLWLSGFSLAMIISLIAAGSAAQVSWPYYATVAATGAHLFHQVDNFSCYFNSSTDGHVILIILNTDRHLKNGSRRGLR